MSSRTFALLPPVLRALFGRCCDVDEVDLEIIVMLMRQLESNYFPDRSTSLLAFSYCLVVQLRASSWEDLPYQRHIVMIMMFYRDSLSRHLFPDDIPSLKSQSTPVMTQCSHKRLRHAVGLCQQRSEAHNLLLSHNRDCHKAVSSKERQNLMCRSPTWLVHASNKR